MEIEGRITGLLEQKFHEEEFNDCFLVEINLTKSNKLQVFVDSDNGIDLRKCKRISRYLEEYLDTGLWLGEKYTLEVSSPGVARPLKLKRQYKKNIGREFSIELLDNEAKQEGKLIEVNDEEITLQKEVVEKVGKKKVKSIQETLIPFEKISKALVKISFKK